MDTKCAAKDGAKARPIRLGSIAQAKSIVPLAPEPRKTANDVLDITVLMGGPSAEREVSLISGRFIADALCRNGHRVTRSDISPTDVSALDRPGIDVVFIALHGEFGESGDVQELCEQRGLRYIGSCPEASRLAMDKDATKRLARDMGVTTADWCVVSKTQPVQHVAELVGAIPLPAVVKPLDGGSSVDVYICRDAHARDNAVKLLLAKYGRAMVEQFIAGREFTVSILGEKALPVIEIVAAHEFYDYDAKYADDAGTQYVFDHGLSNRTVQSMQDSAISTFLALGCRDLSRVDFIVDAAGRPYMLEINTIPGFTSHSLLPMAARRAGLPFDALVNNIVDMAMKR